VNKSEIFQFKKRFSKNFSAYMQGINLKVLKFSIYFTYILVSGPMCAQEISVSIFVELCLGVVVSETSYFLSTSLATFFFSPSKFTRDILAASLS